MFQEACLRLNRNSDGNGFDYFIDFVAKIIFVLFDWIFFLPLKIFGIWAA